MPRPKKPNPLIERAEKVAATLAGFDFGVRGDDFILYELDRLIEEDRASFDDFEFRKLIDEGIRDHVEEKLEIRARLAGLLRTATLTGEARTVAMRVVRALEDDQADLCNVAMVVRTYTAYLFSRLETADSDPIDERITTAADLLFESAGDRSATEMALDVLCATPSPVSARVLAHAISEPLLDEDHEARALAALKMFWPLSRHYMLYSLHGHPHEDIPVRWFQLFIEADELTTVELVLEELRAHGDDPRHREDLATLTEMLQGARDPEIEDKVLDAINSPSTSPAVLPLLKKFLEEHGPGLAAGATPWTRRTQEHEWNLRYLAAAALFDRGEHSRAIEALNSILASEPDYPFALMLKRLAQER